MSLTLRTVVHGIWWQTVVILAILNSNSEFRNIWIYLYIHIHMTCCAPMAWYFEGSVACKYMLIVITMSCFTSYYYFIQGVCWHAATRLPPDHCCFAAAARGSWPTGCACLTTTIGWCSLCPRCSRKVKHNRSTGTEVVQPSLLYWHCGSKCYGWCRWWHLRVLFLCLFFHSFLGHSGMSFSLEYLSLARVFMLLLPIFLWIEWLDNYCPVILFGLKSAIIWVIIQHIVVKCQ